MAVSIVTSAPVSFADVGTGIVFPTADAIVLTPELEVVVSLSEETTGKLVLKLQGQSETVHAIAAGKSYFYANFLLGPGKNSIVLLSEEGSVLHQKNVYGRDAAEQGLGAGAKELYVHSGGVLVENCTTCHLAGKDGLSSASLLAEDADTGCVSPSCHQGLQKEKFQHTPFRENNCIGCHDPHGSPFQGFVAKDQETLCYRCHLDLKNIFEKGKTHFPVANGDCLACHDPHQATQSFQLRRGTIPDLCAGCHGREAVTHKVLHEPTESGDCIACHNPHNSDYDYLLYAKGNSMCFTCHALRREEFKRKFIHEPVQKDCTLCHDPHGSEAPFHLRTKEDTEGRYKKSEKPIKEACLLCHRRLNPQFVEELEQAVYPHKPVAEGNCTACHTPHSTNYRFLLKGPLDKVCFSCHTAMEKHISNSLYKHGPIKNGECYHCHLSHGSDYPNILRAAFSSDFYDDFTLESYALCFNCHNTSMVLKEEAEDTGFRNGRQNLHYLHVSRDKKGRNCKTCHDVHASNQEHHIREKVPYRRRFSISLKYTKTETGGGCIVGCHKPRNYDRVKPTSN